MQTSIFKHFHFFLFLLGQNSFEFRRDKKSAVLKLIENLPRLVLATNTILIVHSTVVESSEITREELPVFILEIILVTVSSALTITERFLSPLALGKTTKRFESVVDSLKRNLNIEIQLEPFLVTFLGKVALVILIRILSLNFKLNFEVKRLDSIEIIHFLVFNHLVVCVMHILCHVDFLQFILLSINREFSVIQADFAEKPKGNFEYEFPCCLIKFKMVHYKLWKISNLLNERFGAILITVVLYNTLTITFASLWIYVNILKTTINWAAIHSKYVAFILY